MPTRWPGPLRAPASSSLAALVVCALGWAEAGCAGNGPATQTVSGMVNELFLLLDGGTTAVAQDESEASPQAFLLQADGTYQVISGTGQTAGTFTIPGLPVDAGYLLAFDTTAFDATNSDVQANFDFVQLGRPNTVPVQSSLPVQVSLEGLAPSSDLDNEYVEVVAANDDLFEYSIQTLLDDGGAGPANSVLLADGGGSTSPTLAGVVDWSQVASGASTEIDPSQGDILTVAQLITLDGGDQGATTASLLVRFADLSGTTITASAATNSLSGNLIPLTGDTPFALSVDRSPASASDFPPGTSIASIMVDVAVLPGDVADAAAYGDFGATADLFYGVAVPSAATTPVVFATSYPNPYPPTWPVLGTVAYTYSLSLSLPQSGGTTTVSLGWFDGVQVAQLPSSYTPGISPPRSLTLNGQAATTTLMGVGATPVLGWAAPATGNATNYEVSIGEVDPVAGSEPSTTTVADFVLAATTTRLVVPDGILDNSGASPSSMFYAQVYAYRMPGLDLTTAPYLQVLPEEEVWTSTALFGP